MSSYSTFNRVIVLHSGVILVDISFDDRSHGTPIANGLSVSLSVSNLSPQFVLYKR